MTFSNKGNFDVRVDEASSTVTYVGKAARLSATSALVWQIKRIFEDGNETIITYADGSDRFNKSWDDRATYTY